MLIRIQPNLVERTVFEAARRDSALRAHYERQFADCYEQREGHLRERAFATLHERWFEALGFRDVIAGVVNEFKQFREKVSRLMVTQAPAPKAQTAELFGTPGEYTVVVAVAPATLLDRNSFAYWARHEFFHIEDLLDPAFGFDAHRRPEGATAAGRNLTQDRYAVLWAMSVDARLSNRGMAPAGVREKRCAELMRAFALADCTSTHDAFERLWSRAGTRTPDHRTLLAWARDGPPGICTDEMLDSSNRESAPGAPCPLCGFPTFDWAQAAPDDERLQKAIVRDFPEWQPIRPICGRCAEIYAACATLQAAS